MDIRCVLVESNGNSRFIQCIVHRHYNVDVGNTADFVRDCPQIDAMFTLAGSKLVSDHELRLSEASARRRYQVYHIKAAAYCDAQLWCGEMIILKIGLYEERYVNMRAPDAKVALELTRQ